jgi:OHCU decarboxylase
VTAVFVLNLLLTQALDQLNALPTIAAEKALLNCCGSRVWAKRIISERPFQSLQQLLVQADNVWFSLAPDDWLEAFRSHPKIGDKKSQQATSTEATNWSEQEQSGVQDASQTIVQLLAQLNSEYEKKFGFIFIICATGKRAEEMLALLRERLGNSPDQELLTAAREQAKITELRIRKLLDQ